MKALNTVVLVVLVACVVFIVSAAPATGQECIRVDTAEGFRLDCTWSGQECTRVDTAEGFRLDCRTRGATTVAQPQPVTPPPQPVPQVVAPQPQPAPAPRAVAQPQAAQPAAERGIVLAGGLAPRTVAAGGQSSTDSQFGYVEGRITTFDYVPYGGVVFSFRGGDPIVFAGLQYPLFSADSMFRIAPRVGFMSVSSTFFFTGGGSIEIGRKMGVQGTLEAGAREGVSIFRFHSGAYFRF